MEDMKQAEKAMKSSLFHKPEPEDAVVFYQNAGVKFTAQQDFASAVKAYECAAEAAKSINLNLPAAVNYQNAATAARRAGFKDRVSGFLREAIPQFQLSGKFVQAANLLIELDLEHHEAGLVEQAVELFVQEGKPAQASVHLFEAAERLAEAEKFEQALSMYQSARELYKKTNLAHKIDQISLVCVILMLRIGDYVGADQQCDYFSNYRSDEALMAEQLCIAYKTPDPDAFKEARLHDGRLGLTNIVLKILADVKCPEAEGAEGEGVL